MKFYHYVSPEGRKYIGIKDIETNSFVIKDFEEIFYGDDIHAPEEIAGFALFGDTQAFELTPILEEDLKNLGYAFETIGRQFLTVMFFGIHNNTSPKMKDEIYFNEFKKFINSEEFKEKAREEAKQLFDEFNRENENVLHKGS